MNIKAFLKKMRPDLDDVPTRHGIEARLTVGICYPGAVPSHKDRLFVVTPRADRQVELGRSKQDRSSPMKGFNDWNFLRDKDGKFAMHRGVYRPNGRKEAVIRIQHADINDAVTYGCRCQRSPDGPTPPGRLPFCTTNDGERARRWNGKALEEIECLGVECPLSQYTTDARGNRFKPAKSFMTIVGRLAVDGFPSPLISLTTGSDVNIHEFVGLVCETEARWNDMCNRVGVDIPMNWYGIPIGVRVFESTGEETRFPRLHFSTPANLEEVFRTVHASMETFHEIGSGIQRLLPAAEMLSEETIEADNAEVLFPESEGEVLDAEIVEPSDEPKAVNSLKQLAQRAVDDADPLADFRREIGRLKAPEPIKRLAAAWREKHPDLVEAIDEIVKGREKEIENGN